MRPRDWRLFTAHLLRCGGRALVALLLAVLVSASGVAAAPITFLPPVLLDLPGAGQPVAADLDGDGVMDLAATGSQGLSVFYGHGDGTFEPRVDLTLLAGWTTAVDVNGDGRTDLVTAQGDAVVVFLNRGLRRFEASPPYPVGQQPSGITAGDFNGDGWPDLAVANGGGNNMCVLLNGGDGTFGTAVFYPGGQTPARIACADYNADGNLDLAMSNYINGEVILYFGDGRGAFTVAGSFYSGGAYPAMILTDDFNGDGQPDLATANTFGNSISVFTANGAGSFSGPALYPTLQYPHIFASGDLDGDGAPDIVAPNNGTSYISILQNQGDGTFLPAVATPSGGSDTRLLTVGDLNGDGLPDVITGNGSSSNFSVLINDTPRPTCAVRSLVLDQAMLLGGAPSSMATVTLTTPAPPGGAVIQLASSNPAVTLPATVTLPEGATSARFPLETTPVTITRYGAVTAGYNGTVQRASLAIRPPRVQLGGMVPNPVTGGQTATGKVTLERPTGPGGQTISLASDTPLVVPPVTIMVPAGATEASFSVPTYPVAAPYTVLLRATGPGSASLRLQVESLGLPLPQPVGTATVPLYNPANGHWYQSVQTTGMTWQQVNDAVAALSYAGLAGHLVTLTTTDETRFVMTFVARPNTEYWFGAYQDRTAPDYSEPAGGWRWVTGEPWGLTNWRAGEPNDLGGDDLVQMKEDGAWNDIGAPGWMNSYLVEYEPAPTAPPTGLQASLVSPPRVALVWTVRGTDETGFELQRRGSVGDWITIATLPAHGSSFADGTLPVFDRYSYRLRAIGPAGPSSWSNEASLDAGPGAALGLDLTALDFGAVLLGSDGGARSLWLTNRGTTALQISSLTLSGPHPADFSVTGAPPAIGPGGAATLTLRFTPARAGSRNALLVITSDAPGSPHTVTLAGIGVPPLPVYAVVDLGALDAASPASGVAWSQANGISSNGVVAGQSSSPDGDPHAILNDGAGTRSLGALSDPNNISGAYGVNAAAQAVGYSQARAAESGATHGFLYSGGGMQDLGTLGGLNSEAHAINDAGQIVGAAQLKGDDGTPGGSLHGPMHAFLMSGGTMRDLGTLGGQNSGALAISPAGRIAGWSEAPGGDQHAFLWEEGRMADLGGLPGRRYTRATGVNDAGQVVGESLNSPAQPAHPGRAFLADRTGIHDLGTLGGSISSAFGINDAGQVVGMALTAADTYATRRAFLVNGGVMIDLNSLLPPGSGWLLQEARAINDRAQIVGVGMHNGQQRAFLFTLPTDPRLAAPTAPTALAVRPVGIGELDLAWTDTSANEHGFELQMKRGDADWTGIGSLPANSTTFAHTGLSPYTHYSYRVRAVNEAGNSSWSNEAAGDTGVQAVARFSLSGDLDWGNQPLGSAAGSRSIVVTNDGNAPLRLDTITLTGDAAGDFTIAAPSPAGAVLAPAASRSLGIVFTPGRPGARLATLTLAHGAPDSPHTITLRGYGIGPALRLSPASLDFGQQPMGLNGTLVVLLQNTGTAPLKVGSMAFQGSNAAEFALAGGTPSSGTLQPGDISLLNIRFMPAGTGSRGAALVIMDDALDSPQSVSLTGTGTAPLLTLNAAALNFPIPPAGDAGVPQTLTFTNAGDAPLTVTGIGLTGPDAGRFRIVRDSGEKNLEPRASRTVQISFSPVTIARVLGTSRTGTARIASVAYSAALEIQHNDPHPDSPHRVTLTAVPAGQGPDAPLPGTPPPAPRAPTVPTGLTGRAASAREINLWWTDTSSNEQAFAIWRKEPGSDWRRVGVVAPNTTTFTDRGLAPGTLYTYRLRATSGNLASDWTSDLTVTTPSPLPASPSHLAATAVSPREIELTWTVPAGGQTGIAIFRQAGAGEWQRIGTVGPNVTQFADRGVKPGTDYRYRTRTHTDSLVSAWTGEATALTPALLPAAPSQLTAVGSSDAIELTWAAATGGETGVALFRRIGTGEWQHLVVVAPGTTRYADRSVQLGMSYTYRVRTHDDTHVSAWSNEATALVRDLPPAVPLNLTTLEVAADEIDLAWKSGGGNETGVAIFRRIGMGEWQRLAIVPPGTTRFVDRGVSPGQSYTYRLRAHNAHEGSAWTNEASGTTPPGGK